MMDLLFRCISPPGSLNRQLSCHSGCEIFETIIQWMEVNDLFSSCVPSAMPRRSSVVSAFALLCEEYYGSRRRFDVIFGSFRGQVLGPGGTLDCSEEMRPN